MGCCSSGVKKACSCFKCLACKTAEHYCLVPLIARAGPWIASAFIMTGLYVQLSTWWAAKQSGLLTYAYNLRGFIPPP